MFRAGAFNLAQRLLRGVRDYPYEARLGKPLTVTASVGVATVSSNSRAPEHLLKTADRALYQAKESGRDRICVDDDLQDPKAEAP